MPIEKKGKALLALNRPRPKKLTAKVAGAKKGSGAGVAAAASVASTAAAAAQQPYESISVVTQPPGSQWCWAACAVMVADFLEVSPLPTVQSVAGNTPGNPGFTTALSAQQIRQMYLSGATGEKINCNVLAAPAGVATKSQLDGALSSPVPVEVAILWNGVNAGGHVVLVVGSDPSPVTGETFYYVNDPDPNTRERTVTYQGLVNGFGHGHWNETVGAFEIA